MTFSDPFRQDGVERLPFRIQSRTADTAVVLHVRGEVDLSTAGELEEAVATALAAGPSALVVDLTEVSFLDSAGLGVLAHGHIKGSERTSFRVVVASQVIEKPLRLTGLDKLLAVYSSVDGALNG